MAADGKFVRVDFIRKQDRNFYICPGEKELKTSGTVQDGTAIKYIASKQSFSTASAIPGHI